MISPNFAVLVQNVALLLAAALVFEIASLNPAEGGRPGRRWLRQVVLGLLLGGISMAVMLTPWQLFPGIRIDTRSVLLGVAGLFFGPVPTLIAMAVAFSFRLFLGGEGTLAGLLIILESGAIGIIWRRLRKPALEEIRWQELFGVGIIIHLVMLACLLTLPGDLPLQVISSVILPVMILFPLGTALLGVILRNRLRRQRVIDELFHTTKRLNDTQLLAKMGGWEYDTETQAMFWTDEVYRVHGMTVDRENLDPMKMVESSLNCYQPESRGEIEKAFRDCGEKGLPYDLELPFTSIDGKKMWVRTKAEAVVENGKIVRVVGNITDITERKLADLALKKSESDYRRIIETANEGIWVMDGGRKTSFVNPHMAAMLGYTPEEILGRPVEEFMFAEDLPEHYRRMKARKKGQSGKYELRFRRKDGGEVWTIVSAIALKDDNGQFAGSFGMFTDITDRKMAEISLRESNETIRAILNATTESVFLMDINGVIIDSNQITAQRLGLDHPEIIGRNMFDLIPPEVAEFRISALRKAVAEGTPVQFEDQREGRWIENHIYPIFDSGSEIKRVAVIGIDITNRKTYEKELRETQEGLRQLLSETQRSRLTLLSVIEDQKEVEEKIRQLNEELEVRVRERTRQLEAVNRELESFSYSVSHDLRSPLRALNGFSDALLSEYQDVIDEKGRQYLSHIQNASNLMGRLIDDMLNLSRITRCEINFGPVDLSQVAREISSELQQQHPAQKVEFHISPNLTVKADPGLIKIALSNLFQNALKYSSKRDVPVITFDSLQLPGERVYLVRDNGVGFNMDYVNKLFIPFQRLHKISEFPGSGIGLSIVKRIITRHGGRVWAEGAVDQGATFYFSLWDKKAE